jgi:hypothetical protein
MLKIYTFSTLILASTLAFAEPSSSLLHPANTPIVVIGNASGNNPISQVLISEKPKTADTQPVKVEDQPQFEAPAEKPRTTTLKVDGTPRGVFKRFGSRPPTLEYVDILVRNEGSEPANGVLVSVVLPDGETLPLEGPGSLKRYEKATYSLKIGKPVSSNTPLRAKLDCENCRTRR